MNNLIILEVQKYTLVSTAMSNSSDHADWHATATPTATPVLNHGACSLSHLNVRHPLEEGLEQLWPKQFLPEDNYGAEDLACSSAHSLHTGHSSMAAHFL